MCTARWDPLYKVLESWQAEGVSLLPGASEAHVREMLDRTGRRYCDDIVEMYTITGGMIDWASGNGLFSFWSLSRIVENNEPESDLLYFGDFLISSHMYGFRAESTGHSSVWLHFDEGPIAGTPQEFFRKYLERSEDLLLLFDN